MRSRIGAARVGGSRGCRRRGRARAGGIPATAEAVLALQRTIGNRAVTALLGGAGRMVQRELKAFTPSADGLSDDVLRQELKAHVHEAEGPNGTFEAEATKLAELLQLRDRAADAKALRTTLRELVRDLDGGAVATLTDRIASIASTASLWGGVEGLGALIVARFKTIHAHIEADDEFKRGKTQLNVSTRVAHMQAYERQLRTLAWATHADVVAKAKAFMAWHAENKDTFYEFDLTEAVKATAAAEKEEVGAWKNEFFFPKVHSRLGLPQGSGQQLYTRDQNYDATYKWHISVAFRTVPGGKQMVSIDRIHVSFKDQRSGPRDKSVWFNIARNDLALASTHGGSPDADQIDHAKTVLKSWAKDYTGFKVGF